MKHLRRISIALAAILAVGLIAIKILFGGGSLYDSVLTEPVFSPDQVDAAIQTDLPPGMVASSNDGRVFYTYHPLHKPHLYSDHVVFEFKDGQSIPAAPETPEALHRVFGITVDQQDRLWGVKLGGTDGVPTEVVAVDINSGSVVYEYSFGEDAAFAQDLRISPDGKFAYLADAVLLNFVPASIVVLDIENRTHRTLLTAHETVSPQNWVIRKQNGDDYRIAFGLLTFLVGVDGIAVSQDGAWLYYATMSHDSLFRIPTAALHDESLSAEQLVSTIERIGTKPLSDGIELSEDNGIVITDVENGGVSLLTLEGELKTLVALPQVNWSDSTVITPNGDIWFTDSRLTDLLSQLGQPSNLETMQARGPYTIYRLPNVR